MKKYLLSYVVTALFFLTLDGVWLSLSSARLYQPILASHLAGQYDVAAIILFYLLYFVGITVFVVRPCEAGIPGLKTALRGVLFGMVAYATYDLTNQATLSGWPWFLSAIDMAWGGFATACAATLTRVILNKFA